MLHKCLQVSETLAQVKLPFGLFMTMYAHFSSYTIYLSFLLGSLALVLAVFSNHAKCLCPLPRTMQAVRLQHCTQR